MEYMPKTMMALAYIRMIEDAEGATTKRVKKFWHKTLR